MKSKIKIKLVEDSVISDSVLAYLLLEHINNYFPLKLREKNIYNRVPHNLEDVLYFFNFQYSLNLEFKKFKAILDLLRFCYMAIDIENGFIVLPRHGVVCYENLHSILSDKRHDFIEYNPEIAYLTK